MHVNEILAAARDGRAVDIREGFAALVAYPASVVVESTGTGFPFVALDRATTGLADDQTVIPDGCRYQLDLPTGATFADGVTVVKKWWREMPTHFVGRFTQAR